MWVADSTTVAKRVSPLKRLMRGTFGLSDFRPGQQDVINSIVKGRDTVAVMPTGAGKSLCYQLPALHLPGVTIVVSPLIALMADQVGKLTDAGVSAVALNSALTAREQRHALEAIAAGGVEFVFTTPERLCTPDFIDGIKGHQIDLVVIDEAHCIS